VFVLFSLALYPGLKAQLVTNNSLNPQGLVQNILLGNGVTVSNVTYNGSPVAIGQFTAANTNLGISSGIVMTTGTTLPNGDGPQGPNDQPGSGVDNNMGGFPLLSQAIGGTQTYNAAILEFDFIPYADTVRFKYVFGSDEYPEFAPPNNTTYNDVFGFFISGPGITGFQNMAKLPNGAVVSINNVNAITNPFYFVNNGDGNTPPYNQSPQYIQYDGFTKRWDIVVYDTDFKPLLLIECKAPSVPISRAVMEQISVYQRKIQAPFLALSNGLEHQVFALNEQAAELQALEDFPSAN